MSVLAVGDGKKYFKEGMKHETAEEWDKAAEAFALAVADNPKNPEYKLHLRRALFNASQMYMKKGAALAAEKDFKGAYVAFRKAYGFDPVNELARSEMARMVRLQEAVLEGKDPDELDENGNVKLVKTNADLAAAEALWNQQQRIETLRNLPHPGGTDLQTLIRDLAGDLDLNVLFDSQSRLEGRKVKIEIKNVTAAKALDYIFLQENLFFQRVGPRTILVADGTRRTNLQQLVLRTFYLANADPKEIVKVIQTAIPAQPGRSGTIALVDEPTNSITIRDTTENIALIGKLISSLDKDRAEVVMDVAIYEVNKNDLLKFGNQLGTQAQLNNLGGVGFPTIWKGSTQPITSGMPFPGLDVASIALGLPISQLSMFQDKNNTRLIASTQIHSFNNKDSSARIGQRVPVRTASFAPVGGTGTNPNNNFVGDVINYEQVGLTLKFKPIVFPNKDVQVEMEIESKDVSGGSTDNPVFTERTIKGIARVQNNKTLLLASVAQNVESNGRQGIPLLGLIPIIGRFFTAPTRDNRQVDIVIAITPRVIRAPDILPQDEVERPTGSLATPTSGSLEAMLINEEREEFLASIRKIPNKVQIQLPDREEEAPAYVRNTAPAASVNSEQAVAENAVADGPTNAALDALNIKPIDASARSLQFSSTSNTPLKTFVPAAMSTPAGTPQTLKASVNFASQPGEVKAGDSFVMAVNVANSAEFRSAVIGFKYDPDKLAVRSVKFGDVFGAKAGSAAMPFLNDEGKTYVSLSLPDGNAASATGTLVYLEVAALADGKHAFDIDRNVLNFISMDGRNFSIER